MESPPASTGRRGERVRSVRYTKEPYLEADPETAPLTTDCTVETELSSLATTRTYSVGSRAASTAGPGWRSNMQGDYNAR